MEHMLSSLPKPHPGLVFFFVTCLALKAFEFPTLTYFYLKRAAAREDELPNMHSEMRPKFLQGECWQANTGTCQQVGLSTPGILAERLEGWYCYHSGGEEKEGCLGHVGLRYLLDIPEEMLNMQSDKQAWHSRVGPCSVMSILRGINIIDI